MGKSKRRPRLNNPCMTCRGPGDCEDCLNDPRNSTPVKLYTPEGAARAMLAGKLLKNKDGWFCFWAGIEKDGKMEFGFWTASKQEHLYRLQDFSGLFEELKR